MGAGESAALAFASNVILKGLADVPFLFTPGFSQQVAGKNSVVLSVTSAPLR